MKRLFWTSLLVTFLVSGAAFVYFDLPDVRVLKRQNPTRTALMELRDVEYRQKNLQGRRQQIWVPYGAISEHVKKAILLAEDAAFFSHGGVDLNELKAALKKDWETLRFLRGGSTITMQLAKNLYLNPSKNPLRKAKEIVIAHQLERELSKPRIFEIYLNVVEWGQSIYGIEAASRHYFSKSAALLDPLEAATLAALLPSPRNSKERSVWHRRNVILSRLASVGHLSNEEAQRAKQSPLFRKVEEEAPVLNTEG
jgi:monofunctional biosynthetic peptidoglycan transglycosylase